MMKEGEAWFDQIQKTNVVVSGASSLAGSCRHTTCSGDSSSDVCSSALSVTNTGTQTWAAGGTTPVRLGVHFGTADDGWGAGWATDQRFALPTDLAPGASVTLSVDVTRSEEHTSELQPPDQIVWGVPREEKNQKTNVVVSGASALAARYTSSPPTSWTSSQTQSFSISVTHPAPQSTLSPYTTLFRSGVHFGTADDGWGAGWATDQRFALPTDLAPGASVTLSVDVTAPTTAGNFILRHRMMKEGVAWFDQIQKTNVVVLP